MVSPAGVAAPQTLTQAGTTPFPPPKTDKPRPHVCATCSRSFARLEHLKRHERSHTKEKPFACPECTRCFARRDLLLRHQQKLHMTATASNRPRTSRRESTSSAVGGGAGRVRKNSVANATTTSGGNAPASMRPRANTISHVDANALGLVTAGGAPGSRHAANPGPRHGHHASLSRLTDPVSFDPRALTTVVGHQGTPSQALPRLETNGLPGGAMAGGGGGGGLRTAPPLRGLPFDWEMDGLYSSAGPGSTINPAQLHFSDSPQSYPMASPTSPYHSAYAGLPTSQPMMEPENALHWVDSFDPHLPLSDAQDYAVAAESSPSALSSASHSGMSDVMVDGSNVLAPGGDPTQWTQASLVSPSHMGPSPFAMDLTPSSFAEIVPPPGTISPKSLHGPFGPYDPYFSPPPPTATMSPNAVS